MDFKDLQKKAKTAKALILCNPHNPVGRVWSKKELEKLAKIAQKNDLLIISDEIHSDIILGKNKFISFSSLPKKLIKNSVSLFSPSKTFNLPSISGSFIYTQNQKILKKLDAYMESVFIGSINPLSATAMVNAYDKGDIWLDKLLVQIKQNKKFIKKYLKKSLPQVKMIDTQGTYLVWLDFSQFKQSEEDINKILLEDAKVALSPSSWYEKEHNSKGFFRMCIATSQNSIKQALDNLSKALKV